MKLSIVPISVLLSLTFTTVEASAEPQGSVNGLAIWSRGQGNHSDNAEVARVLPKVVELASLPLVVKKLHDVQYGEARLYQGIALADLLATYKGQPGDDTALLRFANGMQVPVSLSTAALRELNGFVAIAVCTTKTQCTADFPEIAKEDAYSTSADPRPITFSWNKLVLPSAMHPAVRGKEEIFSPWYYVDSLKEIELVNLGSYMAQFEVGEERALKVFRRRCQFCHGARQVGANFGWDFVTPLPLHTKHSPDRLLNHVKYPKAYARKMGLKMPPQSDVTEAEMKAVWSWMKVLEKKPLRPYR